MKQAMVAFWIAAIVSFAAAGETLPAGTPATLAEGEMIQLSFPENMEVRLLVEYVSKRLGVNILYDESIGRKRVTISAPTRIPKDSLMGLLKSVLKMAELAIVDAEQGGWKKIVQGRDLLAVADRVELDAAKLATAEAGKVVTQVFEVRNVSVAAVEKTIQPFLSKPGGNSFPIAEQGLLFVTDYASSLRRIAGLIEMMDKPGRRSLIRFVALKHRDAADLARQVTALLGQKDRLSATERKPGRQLTLTSEPYGNQIVMIFTEGAEREALELIETLDVPSQAETQTYRFRYVAPQRIERIARDLTGADRAKGAYKSVIDAESGMLIVTAPPAVHEKIAELQRQLDVPESDPQLSHVRFYKLMNTTASQVLATIRSLETGEAGLAGLTGLPMQTSERSAGTPGKFTGPNVPPPPVGEELPKPPSYRPSKKDDRKAATQPAGPPPTTARTKDATVTIDPNTNTIIVVAAPSVQRIYQQLIKMLDRRRPQVMIEVTLVTLDASEDFSLGVDLSHAGTMDDHRYLVFSSFGLSTVDSVTGSLALKPGVGLNAALIGPTKLNAVLKALATSGRSKVVSAPRVLVNDNATATLTSVSEAPFTSINASDTVATTSFAGYASAGSTLTVTPHISEGDHLQLQYSITLNSFTGEGSAGVPPPRQTNTINSEVTVPNGYAVVVGGLRRSDISDTASKIPLLGDIPILGKIFSLTTRTDVQSTLFAFIRPVILRDDEFENLKYLSDRDLELAELPANLPESNPIIMR